ncbi:oxidoreductase [Zalerion maritima]|uniref:Oxidoreductase n=1 Tax=Zalerion maritima TaxID=339359 RepID=A0AAD5RNK2_9PEZI|nr:oxidoreductase [Zalerion maritima]
MTVPCRLSDIPIPRLGSLETKGLILRGIHERRLGRKVFTPGPVAKAWWLSWVAIVQPRISWLALDALSTIPGTSQGTWALGPVLREDIKDVGGIWNITFQETFLMDEDLTFKKGEYTSVEAAAVLGVGVLMEAPLEVLWLIIQERNSVQPSNRTGLEVPSPGTSVEEKDEWIVVMGASGTVGQYAVQIARLCGYKVLAGCSKEKSSGYELGMKAWQEVSKKGVAKQKDKVYFATVDDWSLMPTPDFIIEYRVRLGHLGRDADLSPHGVEATESMRKILPGLEAQVLAGSIKPVKYNIVPGEMGWDGVIEGIAMMEKGEGGQRITASGCLLYNLLV